MANEQNLKPWKPGQSGNPAGRPIGAVSLSTRIQRMMNDNGFVTQAVGTHGRTTQYKGEPVEAIIRTAALKAMSGDVQWANWLAIHGYGQSRRY